MIDNEQNIGLFDYYGLRLKTRLNPERHGELGQVLRVIQGAIDKDRAALFDEHEWSPVLFGSGLVGGLISSCATVGMQVAQYPEAPAYWLMTGFSGLSVASIAASPVVYAAEAARSRGRIWKAHQSDFSKQIREALGIDKEIIRTVIATTEKPQPIDLFRTNFSYDFGSWPSDVTKGASLQPKDQPQLRLQSVNKKWYLVNSATSLAIRLPDSLDKSPLCISASAHKCSFSTPLSDALNCKGVADNGDILLYRQGSQVFISPSDARHHVRIRVRGDDQPKIIPIDLRFTYHDSALLELSGPGADKGFAVNRQYMAKNQDLGFLLSLGEKRDERYILIADGLYDIKRGTFIPFPQPGQISESGVDKTNNPFNVVSAWTLNNHGEPVSVAAFVSTAGRKLDHNLDVVSDSQLFSWSQLKAISSNQPVRMIRPEADESEFGILIGSDADAIPFSLKWEVREGHKSFTLSYPDKQPEVVREGESVVIGGAGRFSRLDDLKVILLGGKIYFFFEGSKQAVPVYLGTAKQITREVTRRAKDIQDRKAATGASRQNAELAAQRERERKRSEWVTEAPPPDAEQYKWNLFLSLESLALGNAISKDHFCHIIGDDVFIIQFPVSKELTDDTISIESPTYNKYLGKRVKFVEIIAAAQDIYRDRLATISSDDKKLTEGPALDRRRKIKNKVIKQFAKHPDVTRSNDDEDLTHMVLELMDDKCPFDPAADYPFL